MIDPLRRSAKRLTRRVVEAVAEQQAVSAKASPATKVSLRELYLRYRGMAEGGEPMPRVEETGFRVFSQFEEDGIILFLLGVLGIGPGKFVDVGGGDGVKASNCANLALNFGFDGLFVDQRTRLVEAGREFYRRHPDTSLHPPRFVHATVTRGNVNSILRSSGFDGEVDLLSVDIDGNDYWVWEAIDCIVPRIVVIETHPEFGDRSIVVPYAERPAELQADHPLYAGASPLAMTKLAKRKGYRFVGANRFGFNAFYIRDDLGREIPEADMRTVFRHHRSRERMALFENIRDLPFENV